MYSVKILFISSKILRLGSIFFCEIISLISEEASTPTSDLIKSSSISLRVLSSISFLIIISLSPKVIFSALFLKPSLNFRHLFLF